MAGNSSTTQDKVQALYVGYFSRAAEASLQVGGQADIALVGRVLALKQIDVDHRWIIQPSHAKASEGILLRARVWQGLFCVARSAKQNGGAGRIRTRGSCLMLASPRASRSISFFRD